MPEDEPEGAQDSEFAVDEFESDTFVSGEDDEAQQERIPKKKDPREVEDPMEVRSAYVITGIADAGK
ncbi:hypothetical protein VTN96DRAFT_7982 [Rasamsonia emersonii]